IEKLQGIKYMQSPNLEEAVLVSKDYARKGDIVLFSPGCEAIGVHISRRERGEKFVKAVRSL
ncbi:MAG TPA: UDP-N-acetylmuramoyl-L-alanine--D-glutamate ligase, partial [Candidatus Paceibacterota bacterium]